MFERFSQRARNVVVEAQNEARRAGAAVIGTEHLLLAMLADGEGSAYEALHEAGVTLDDARAETARQLGLIAGPLGAEDAAALKTIGIDLSAVVESVEQSFGSGALSRRGVSPNGHIPFSKRAKKVLELSLREALRLNNDYIGTGHLLLGLIREHDGLGMTVLVNSGIDVTAMRDRLVTALNEESTRPAHRFGTFGDSGRFTAPLNDVVLRAGEEARRCNQRFVGTEHLLLALADLGTGPAYTALVAAGLSADRIRGSISAGKPSGLHLAERLKIRGRSALAPDAKAALALSGTEAIRLGHDHVGTEHLLLAIMDNGDGPAVEILRTAGVSFDRLRASLVADLGEAA
jgi:ATP-dependent Clp protease ATP-binding subunit ClpA